mmetsp:Transcript_28736/g.82203  ORF Transcript_28736/g.82203 Transcript_28736/m.82203 type:complete len:856 (+) Transcript_28736:66-2633(+)
MLAAAPRVDPARGPQPLLRPGLSVLGSPKAAPVPDQGLPPPELEGVGARLVSEVASLWSSKYLHTIRHQGCYDGAFHYECLFSCPTNEAPVPSFVICVRFALVAGSAAPRPRLLFRFEEGDLLHEWALDKTSAGTLFITKGQQEGSLRDGVFEKYLDSYVHEKETVRARGINLVTPFEESRLPPPPMCTHEDSVVEAAESSESEEQHESEAARLSVSVDQDEKAQQDPEMGQAMREALKAAGLACEKVPPPASLSELLANVFDAADEDGVGELPHHEVARLLGATLPGFGLEEWDIHLLLTSAQENEEGFIECQPFIQVAPEIIQALRKRRMAYRARGLPGVEIPVEAIDHCFNDEVTGTVEDLQQAFEQCSQEDPSRGLYYFVQHPSAPRKRPTATNAGGHADSRRSSMAHTSPTMESIVSPGAPAGGTKGQEQVLVGLKRRFCRECIQSLPERLSPQEVNRLMQMLPEDEDGFVHIDDITERLKALRTESLLNALVETDVQSLRTHLVLKFRQLGLGQDAKLKLWMIKHALLDADQVCLSRLQIHVLLCLCDPDEKGNVDVAAYLVVLCSLIPHMCNARTFVETSDRLQVEHEEARRRNVLAELAALGAAKVGNLGSEEEEQSKEPVVDQLTVERTLIQVLTLSEESHRSEKTLAPESIFRILRSNDTQVQSCQLSEFEVCGLVAEMNLDARGEVAYIDHVKRWVPIIFELRKHQLLSAYLKEGASETLGIQAPDPAYLETLFPLMPEEPKVVRRPSKARSGSMDRRPSMSMSRRMSKESVGSLASHFSERRLSSIEDVDGKKESQGSGLRLRGSTMPRHQSREDLGINRSTDPPPGRGYQRRKDRVSAATPE